MLWYCSLVTSCSNNNLLNGSLSNSSCCLNSIKSNRSNISLFNTLHLLPPTQFNKRRNFPTSFVRQISTKIIIATSNEVASSFNQSLSRYHHSISRPKRCAMIVPKKCHDCAIIRLPIPTPPLSVFRKHPLGQLVHLIFWFGANDIRYVHRR